MPSTRESQNSDPHGIVISIDAMGGDLGPGAVVSGMAKAARKHPGIRFEVYGDNEKLSPMIKKQKSLRGRCKLHHTDDVVEMTSIPSSVVRNGRKTSMWSAIDAVSSNQAQAVVSCGNTGALMALSMLRLKKAPGTKRPAMACHWPSRNSHGSSILLDVGANISADEQDLRSFAILGANYARIGLGLAKPRVGLLNIGKEYTKGRREVKAANSLISEDAEEHGFEYVGYLEGSDIPTDVADVYVTDGFTGNAMIKSVEGTAALLRQFLREAFNHTFLSRIGALFALTSLRRLSKRIDPRRVNGAVFLGLDGTVVKSHGSADAVAIAAAVDLAVRLSLSGPGIVAAAGRISEGAGARG